eukprot:2138093-Pleurochrysis_carterae.AAC.1
MDGSERRADTGFISAKISDVRMQDTSATEKLQGIQGAAREGERPQKPRSLNRQYAGSLPPSPAFVLSLRWCACYLWQHVLVVFSESLRRDAGKIGADEESRNLALVYCGSRADLAFISSSAGTKQPSASKRSRSPILRQSQSRA